jgi:hypothetical protein
MDSLINKIIVNEAVSNYKRWHSAK